MSNMQYYVYILSSTYKRLYIGVTNNLSRRCYEHKLKLTEGFTLKYNITALVYFEVFSNIDDAIARETQLKGWRREKKISLIEAQNSQWKDLSEGWFEPSGDSSLRSE